MPDLAVISSALSGISTAIELAKGFRDAGLSLEQAEYKLKLAELVEKLADAKSQIASIQDLIGEKDRRIKELEKAAEIRGKIMFERPYYWLIDNDKKDGPYCQKCFDGEGQLIRLQDTKDGRWHCMQCREFYHDSSYTPIKIPPPNRPMM